MNVNAVSNCTHIVRSQVEYNAATQTVILRCILEITTTGKRLGFTDVDALMDALRAELIDMQIQIVSRSISNDK